MTDTSHHINRPLIVVADSDYERLANIAERAARRGQDAAEALLVELDHAQVVPSDLVPARTVRMGSHVRYRDEAGAEHDVTLVFPAEADIADMKISVLTPVGAALIGLSEGQSLRWHDLNRREHVLTIVRVS